MSAGPLTRSAEDYLKAIYGLCEAGDAASTSAIAVALDIQPASVTGMVKRLAESGLVEHVLYRGVRLTKRGTREALRVLRRHRILETYLCERLGFSWDDVHGEAERLEHAASDALIEKMAAALEFPVTTRTGHPSPPAPVTSRAPIPLRSPTRARATACASGRSGTSTPPTSAPWPPKASCLAPGSW